jgi:hypothetical protein
MLAWLCDGGEAADRLMPNGEPVITSPAGAVGGKSRPAASNSRSGRLDSLKSVKRSTTFGPTPANLYSAFCDNTTQLVPTLPRLAVKEIAEPFINQIARLPLPSFHRMSLIPSPL